MFLGIDTITLPIEIFRNATLPRTPKESSTSIIKQSLRQSIGRSSLLYFEQRLTVSIEIQTRQFDLDVRLSARLSLRTTRFLKLPSTGGHCQLVRHGEMKP